MHNLPFSLSSHKFSKMCRYLSNLFKLCAAGVLIGTAIFWTFADLKNQTLFGFPVVPIANNNFSDLILGDVTNFMRILAFLASLPLTLCSCFIYQRLSRLFYEFYKGNIFVQKNVHYIQHISKSLIIIFFGSIIENTLLSYIVSMNNPVGRRMIGISFGTNNLTILITGLIVMAAAYVMEEGLKLEQEQQLTI